MISTGIHHITAISSDARTTHDFYAKTLGLRLVKKSVNQDDVSTYHLFFGNRVGSPGMDMTFFPFQPSSPARNGLGCVSQTSFAVPTGSLAFWQKRFASLQVKHNTAQKRFGRQRLALFDEDGQSLELVEVDIKDIDSEYQKNLWTTAEIDQTVAIHSFHSATLQVKSLHEISPMIEILGYTLQAEQVLENGDKTYLYQIAGKTSAAFLEVFVPRQAPFSQSGAGGIHHIAFGVKNEQEQLAYRLKLASIGVMATEVIDRYYFKSIYFRTKAGILCEIATNGPGFSVDEATDKLGESLALPPFLEKQRAWIEANLPKL